MYVNHVATFLETAVNSWKFLAMILNLESWSPLQLDCQACSLCASNCHILQLLSNTATVIFYNCHAYHAIVISCNCRILQLSIHAIVILCNIVKHCNYCKILRSAFCIHLSVVRGSAHSSCSLVAKGVTSTDNMLAQAILGLMAALVVVQGQLTPAQHAFLQKGMAKRLRRDVSTLCCIAYE